ncbi:MAG: hypothetical protein QOG57_820, partial [Pseudonocardiales bacterium]|nr:hypothetical protein [Pseudonocardiales bacterium]
AALPALARLGHAQLRAWDAAIRADVAAQTGHFEGACTYGRVAISLAVGIGEPVSASTVLPPWRGRSASSAVLIRRPSCSPHMRRSSTTTPA